MNGAFDMFAKRCICECNSSFLEKKQLVQNGCDDGSSKELSGKKMRAIQKKPQ